MLSNRLRPHAQPLPVEEIPLEAADGRVLAEALHASRDYPALARSVRDGFAVRAEETPGRLQVIGEVRAGETFSGALARGEAVEIMTGAPVPAGADAVVMVEHTRREGEFVSVPAAVAGQNISPQGADARAGEELIPAGRRLGFPEIALAASEGGAQVRVFRKPSCGDPEHRRRSGGAGGNPRAVSGAQLERVCARGPGSPRGRNPTNPADRTRRVRVHPRTHRPRPRRPICS